jgi:hypothetical protein
MMPRQHPADNVFVDIDAESVRNLLCDAGTANTGVAAFELEVLRLRLGVGIVGTSLPQSTAFKPG